MEITLARINSDPRINEFIRQTEKALKVQGFTEHGFRHANLVASRARTVAQMIGLSKKEQELAAVAGYCHDMANFLGRTHHHYWGALLFGQLYLKDNNPKDVALVMQAIANHDKEEMKLSNPISAVLVLADKSDVHRERVSQVSASRLKVDIHNRVNYATIASKLGIDKKTKEIKLSLKIDTKIVPIMEYFEIFTQRMVYCRKAAEYLGYKFTLEINKFKLL